nr:DEAD-box type RNA helicase [Polyrhizophydium stewartii]
MREMAQLKAERDNLHALESKDEAPSLESSTSTTRRISEINSRLAALRKQLDGESIVRSDGTAELERLKRNLRLKILVEADVVLTTLSGAGHDIFTDLRDCEFQTVIVDEACQSVELSCLIPLRYGARKCIMVGGCYKMSFLLYSIDLSYDQSLFQRIMKNCMGSIHLLSFHFYESQLKDAEGLEQTCAAPWHENAFFQPYKFLDVASGREQTGFGKSLYNTEEAQLCVALVKKLCWLHRELNRRAVITFYKLQARKLKDTFVNHFGRRILDVIDINTIMVALAHYSHV